MNVKVEKTVCPHGFAYQDGPVLCHQSCAYFDPAIGCVDVEHKRVSIAALQDNMRRQIAREAVDYLDQVFALVRKQVERGEAQL